MEIIALYEELGSYRAVAALLGCDHKTVKRYVELAGELGQLAPARRRARVTDDYRGLIRETVEQARDRPAPVASAARGELSGHQWGFLLALDKRRAAVGWVGPTGRPSKVGVESSSVDHRRQKLPGPYATQKRLER